MIHRWDRYDWMMFAAVIGALLVAWASYGRATEFYPSLDAARAAHPTAHLSYAGNHECWYIGEPRNLRSDCRAWKKRQTTTASVLDRPRSRSTHILDTPQVAGASRTPLSPERQVMRNDSPLDKSGAGRRGSRAKPEHEIRPVSATRAAQDTARCSPEQGLALADELLPLSMIARRLLLAEMKAVELREGK